MCVIICKPSTAKYPHKRELSSTFTSPPRINLQSIVTLKGVNDVAIIRSGPVATTKLCVSPSRQSTRCRLQFWGVQDSGCDKPRGSRRFPIHLGISQLRPLQSRRRNGKAYLRCCNTIPERERISARFEIGVHDIVISLTLLVFFLQLIECS